MNILNLIEKKKNNQRINEAEFDWFIKNLLNKNIKDYQTSAFLMSIWFSKLDFDETYYLTKAIVNNGKIFKYPSHMNKIIDKHSTGGVGDKVSLILLPILASLGVDIAKISGRGLGYTGGTIDKLDSINVNTDINEVQAIDFLEKDNMFIMQQTDEIVPADKILYAIRDTSGTVDDISLIAASIMSKKIATNANYIYLDVKVGDGAFFADIDKAMVFGEMCIKLGKKFDKKVVVHYTDMDKPLGRCLGNLIEVKEAINFLNGNYECKYLKELIYEFAKDILLDLNLANSDNDAFMMIENTINSKNAFNKFKQWAKDQGSNLNFDENMDIFYNPLYKKEICAKSCGYINFKSNKTFGITLIDLKAGRKTKEDKLDFKSGIYLNKYNGEYVNTNDIIITLYASEPISDSVIKKIEENIEILKDTPKIKNTILGMSR